MKKRGLLWMLVCILVLSGCKAPREIETTLEPPATVEPTPDPSAQEIKDFFRRYVDTKERPIAVMVDNDDKNARPHAGLDEAYLIYEMVIEGGATRFLAFFRDAATEKIGPVRSSRHYFLDYLMEHDGIYVHYGWSPKAIQDISAFGIEKINGVLGTDGHIFWREEKFRGDWHSAYTSVEKIKEITAQKGYATETGEGGLSYADTYFTLPAENSAETILLTYSGFYSTGYCYNSETGLYEKTIDHAPHVMQNGNRLAVKNVIVQFATDVSLGDGSDRRDLNTTGSGRGYYLTGGAYEEITWSKASRQADTVYMKADGTPLVLNPGKTIVNIISSSANVTIEP